MNSPVPLKVEGDRLVSDIFQIKDLLQNLDIHFEFSVMGGKDNYSGGRKNPGNLQQHSFVILLDAQILGPGFGIGEGWWIHKDQVVFSPLPGKPWDHIGSYKGMFWAFYPISPKILLRPGQVGLRGIHGYRAYGPSGNSIHCGCGCITEKI